jgi:hypothetical protein
MAAIITSKSDECEEKRVCDLIPEKDDVWCWSVFKGLKAQAMNYCKLYPPGDVYWVYYKNEENLKTETEEEEEDITALNESFYAKTESITTPLAAEEGFQSSSDNDDERKRNTCDSTRKLVFAKVKDVVDLFNYPRFSKTMFTDHSPKSYEDVMRILLRNGGI